MPRDPELDRLKAAEQSAFQRKQAAFQRYADARDRANEAHDEMERAWQERCSAREEMNREFERKQQAWERYHSVWDEYGSIRESNSSRIDQLRSEADYEHQAMQDAFEQASSEYEYGDKSMAPYYSQQGHEHKARRDDLNDEVSQLCQEIKDARARAEWSASKPDDSAFQSAKARFDSAKAYHESAQARFKSLKAERDRAKDEFDSLQEEWKRLKDAFQTRLEQVKASKQATKQKAVDKVNMALVRSNAHYLGTLFGQDAKIVPRKDSAKVDVYFGGLNAAGDGIGHGHAVIDEYGNVTYLRDAWVVDKKNDYLIDERADKYGKPTHKF